MTDRQEIGFAAHEEKMQQNRFSLAVLGAGSWGTALAMVLAAKGNEVLFYCRNQEQAAEMAAKRENSRYLPGFKLCEQIKITSELKSLSACPVLVLAIPSHGFRTVFRSIAAGLSPNTALISATKGIENESLLTMSQVMREELSHYPEKNCRIGVLAGPSFAREVAAGIPTAVTVAAEKKEDAIFFQELFFRNRFRVYAGTDLIGQELGGALKNIIAIAAGISDGYGYGTNTRAALITRGLAEITRLGVKMGAHPLTFSGLAGMGDLVLTCTGELSRNRSVGLELGRGRKIAEIVGSMRMVAEGVKTTSSAMALAKREGVEMPILEAVYEVLYNDKSCKDAVEDLLSREGRHELEMYGVKSEQASR